MSRLWRRKDERRRKVENSGIFWLTRNHNDNELAYLMIDGVPTLQHWSVWCVICMYLWKDIRSMPAKWTSSMDDLDPQITFPGLCRLWNVFLWKKGKRVRNLLNPSRRHDCYDNNNISDRREKKFINWQIKFDRSNVRHWYQVKQDHQRGITEDFWIIKVITSNWIPMDHRIPRDHRISLDH